MKARGNPDSSGVAPGTGRSNLGKTESAKYHYFKPSYYALSELRNGDCPTQGRLPMNRDCPWLSYSAPLALLVTLIRLLRQSHGCL